MPISTHSYVFFSDLSKVHLPEPNPEPVVKWQRSPRIDQKIIGCFPGTTSVFRPLSTIGGQFD